MHNNMFKINQLIHSGEKLHRHDHCEDCLHAMDDHQKVDEQFSNVRRWFDPRFSRPTSILSSEGAHALFLTSGTLHSQLTA